MKSVKVYHYDAFSKEPNKGNPAGVVLNGEELTEEEMQEVAFKVGFNETAFPVQSDIADLRLRFFTPGHEMNLCGHGTMAMVYALKTKGFLGDKTDLTIETKAGILPVKIDNQTHITMKQAAPQFQAFHGSKEELAHAIGLTKEEIDEELPVLYGSTGNWTLVIPIKKLASFEKMKPNNESFPTILKEIPQASIHPICLETYHSEADMHGRHFSSPNSGTTEDPVTGTASGVMGAYYAKYIKPDVEESLNLVVEQGQEMGKDGLVQVHVVKTGDSYEIEITGNAVYVKEFEVIL
ncbi:PhzF family phenazine biosynthesis isomerase [Neobacillus cucumis]|uniref:Isomerase n=1 Tax=Neobacillus cucumis TaxID=1740721 RepID=A0A2N5HR74_9BACI|nr:PhzF family phenazine biosynthesis isomerase [Neobacillus cucumis]PLS08014.1 isomerase [Neobacillus cucumis]